MKTTHLFTSNETHIFSLGKLLGVTIVLVLALASTQYSHASEPEVVRFGTEGAYAPFTFIDANGNLDGYDIAVARAVDELIPDLTFEFIPTEWSSIFVALEAGNFDGIVNQISRNEDREAKYLFSDVPYSWSSSAIIFASGRTDITAITSLHGKTVTAGLGTANTTWLEGYNAENGNPINISYSDGDISKMLQEIINGRVDATLNSPITTKLIADEQGLDVEWINWVDNGIVAEYFLFARSEDGERYKALIDAALQTLLENGTLAELSNQYLGADYSTKSAVEESN